MKNEKKQKPTPKNQNNHVKIGNKLLKNEVWLTSEEAMVHLNISKSTLYRMRKKKNIPSFKLGGIPMYPKYLLNRIFLNKSLNNLKKSLLKG